MAEQGAGRERAVVRGGIGAAALRRPSGTVVDPLRLADIGAVAFLTAFLLLPLAVIVLESIQVVLTGGLAELPGFLTYLIRLTRNSLVLAAAVTSVCVGVSVPLAVFTARVVRYRAVFIVGLTLPLLAPPFVSAFATIILLGRVGLLTQLLGRVGIRLFDIYGFPGVAITHILHLTPLAYLTILAGLRTVPKAIEESAISLGSGPLQTVLRVVIPYIASYIYMAALLVFLASFGDVGAPLIVGGNFLVLPTEAYTRFLSFTVDPRVPVLLASWIIAISVIIMFGVRTLMRRAEIAHTFTAEQHEYDSVWMRAVGTVVLTIVAAGLLLPYLVILIMSVTTVWGPQLLPKGWTMAHYREVWRSVGPLRNSLVISLSATPVAVLLAIALGRMMREGGRRWAALDYITLLPFVTSGVVLGIGIVKVYSALEAAGLAVPLLSGPVLLVAALVTRRLPYPVRVLNAGYSRIDRSLEECSHSLGASPARTFKSVTLPQLYPAILAAATITFIQVISELGTTLIVHRPTWRTLPVQIYGYAVEGYLGRASALSITLLGLVGVAILLTNLNYRPRRWAHLRLRRGAVPAPGPSDPLLNIRSQEEIPGPHRPPQHRGQVLHAGSARFQSEESVSLTNHSEATVTRVRLRHVAKAFGPVWAVRDVTLDVAEGEFFSLLGPSGCGKTTTLRIIAGLEKPTRGRVWFGDEDVTHVPPQFRNIGLVFQSYAVFPTMTVYDNVAYGLRIRGLPDFEVRRRVHEMLDLVGLTSLANRMPGQISGGQLQRVALARALAIRPRLLLLDEPLSSLDAKLRLEVRGEIRRLQRELGITAIYVTHDQEEALSISDRVGVMNQGVLHQVGPPEEIYRQPATRFVAAFVGEGTLLEGILERDGGREQIVVDGQVRFAVRAGGIPPGPVWACIRPEAVRVHLDPCGEGLPGVVQQLERVGPIVRSDVRLAATPLTVRMAAWATRRDERLRVGQRVWVVVDPDGVAVGRLTETPEEVRASLTATVGQAE